MTNRETDFDLTRLWHLIAQNIRWILLSTLIVGLLTYALSSIGGKVYESSTRLLAVANNASSSPNLLGSLPNSPLLSGAAYKEAALSNTVFEQTLKLLSIPSSSNQLEGLRQTLKFKILEDRDSKVLILSAQDNSPEQAAHKATAWANALLKWEDDRTRGSFRTYRASLEAQLQSINNQIARAGGKPTLPLQTLQAQLTRDIDLVGALERSANGQLTLLDSSTIPDQPIAPKPLRNAAIGAALALLLSLGLMLLREALERRVRSSEEAQAITGLPLLAEFPRLRKDEELPGELGSYLLANIGQLANDESPKVIGVVSPARQDGRTNVALSLAKTYARTGKRTLLIDLDTVNPQLHNLLQVSPYPDVFSVMKELPVVKPPTAVGRNLYLFPCNNIPRDATAFISESFPVLINFLRNSKKFDVIIIDTAPILIEPATMLVAAHMTGVVMTVSEGSTERKHLRSALELIQRTKVPVLGLAVTNLELADTVRGQILIKNATINLPPLPNITVDKTPKPPKRPTATDDLKV